MPKIIALLILFFLIIYLAIEHLIRKHNINKVIDFYINKDKNIEKKSFVLSLMDTYCKFINKHMPLEKILKPQDFQKNKDLLLQAGFEHPNNILLFFTIKILLALCLGVLLYILNSNSSPLLWAFIGFAAGLFAPELYLKNVINKKLEEFGKYFPDALDLMVICSQAGLNIEKILEVVHGEFKEFALVVSKEIEILMNEMRVFQNKSLALENFKKRVPLKSVETFSMNIIQMERIGTSLSDSLKIISKEIRRDQITNLEEEVGKVSAKIGLPIIMCILFPLIVVLGGPPVVMLIRQLGNM